MGFNNIKRILIFFSMFIILIGLANALCWKCTINYDGSVSYTCDYNVCNWHECADEGIPIGSCGEGSVIDAQPPNLSVSSPVEGNIYSSREVLIGVSSDEIVKNFKRKVDRESYQTICSGCSSGSYLKTRLADGQHSVSLTATDYKGNTAEKIINFSVDTISPNIKYVFPGNNFFVKGASNEEFKIRYDEENLNEITLYYKINSGSEKSKKFSGCENGQDKECRITLDLSSAKEGDKIEFYIKISDKAGHVVNSNTKTTTVNAELAENPFTIVNPADNGKYGDRKVSINVDSALNADLIEYSIDGKKFNKFCALCEDYEKLLGLSDGEHSLTIRATYEETKVEKTVNFYIDSLKPAIKITTPKIGSWVKGNTLFTVKYNELYLESVILHYGTEGEGRKELQGCEAGNNKECSIMVDLSSYNGEEILYSFELKDKVNSVNSNTYNLLVDVDKPIITLNNPNDEEIYTSEKVLFDIGLDDYVSSLSYIDNYNGARSLKPVQLCKNCDGYEKELRLKEGEHNLKIMATDPSGNANEININFRIDTRYPRFNRISTYGRTLTNGEFTLTYNEMNLVEVVGHYRGIGEASFKTQSFGDCLSGGRADCVVKLNLNSYDDKEIQYYFELIDVLGQSVTSDGPVTIAVDAEKPQMDIGSIENLEVFNDRNVLIDIDLSEEVKSLVYIDNGATRPITLCSGCSGYERMRSFSRGAHQVKFIATDYAGNTAEETKNFVVNY